jgi:hypothetical protein
MASTFRYRRGDYKPQLFKTDPAYPIEEGDLVFQHPSNGCIRPASSLLNQGSAALNQDAFQQYFAGVAMNKIGLQPGEKSFRLTTDLGYCVVATAGEFEFDCDSYQWSPGELVGVWADTAGCANQKVAPAASESLAIAQASPGITGLQNAMTRVTVAIQSVVFGRGIQAQVSGAGSGQ